jgi:cytochrome c553
MKRLITLFSLVAIVAIACHKKAMPVVTDRTSQPPAPSVAAPPVVDSAAINLAAELSAGKTVYDTKCTRCHMDKGVANFTAERWPNILRSMIPKARLTEIESRQVTAYVMANAKKS